MELLNVWDYERLAAERLDEGAYGYFAGGANDEWTLRDNVEAFQRWQLRPRVMVDVAEPSTVTTVLGHRDRATRRSRADRVPAASRIPMASSRWRERRRQPDDHVPLDLLDHVAR